MNGEALSRSDVETSSSVASSSVSPFRRRRFDRGETRSQALERRLLRRLPSVASTAAHHHTTNSNNNNNSIATRQEINDDEKKEDDNNSSVTYQDVKDDNPLKSDVNETITTSITTDSNNSTTRIPSTEHQYSNQPKIPNSPLDNDTDNQQQEVWLTPPRKTSLQKHLDIIQPRKCLEENTCTTTDVTDTSTQHKLEQPNGYTALNETLSPADTSLSNIRSSVETDTKSPRRRPLHEDMVYYRVIYRGVVALLSGPDAKAPRSGHYLGYGEIFGSTQEIALPDDVAASSSAVGLTARTEDHGSFSAIDSFLDSPPRSIFSLPGSVSSMDTFQTKSTHTAPLTPTRKPPRSIPQPLNDENGISHAAICVQDIITGGYAKDAADTETPKRSNLDEMSQLTTGVQMDGTLGYIFARQKGRDIIQRLPGPPPTVEEGVFRYKIASSTPLPILTGPAWDAPRTKAMVLPGTTHEVSLRVSFDKDSKLNEEYNSDDKVWFLRMSHRRGWIATHRQGRSQAVVKEINNGDAASDICSIVSSRSVMADDAQSVLSSIAVSSVATPTAVAQRRHRPPRRRREVEISRSHHAADHSRHATPSKNISRAAHEQQLYTPSSNVSLLSDDSSLERRHHHQAQHFPDSPDVSYATQRSNSSTVTTVTNHYLFRVTAPKGLAVLDAPHYQVNNLIRGKPPTNPVIEPPQGKSILKTMPGRTASSSLGADPSSKKRVIPRGALFEASKRMESSGAFSQGAGLIKLSDNSGWAIIPHRDELERQYKNFQGDLTLIRQGEASRAVEEVGNTCLDGPPDRPATLWFRIYSRSGVTVQCAPHTSSTSDEEDDNTSPSSSRGGSSVVSGSNHGSIAGGVASQESDVTSSVASTFVDAMLFRTPKKRDGEQTITTSRQQDQLRNRVAENPINLTIPCGNCIEVERWVDLSMDQRAIEYARLAGGQGWIPLMKSGRSLLTPVVPPEYRFGSFWFRVQSGRGIKVRLGPSIRAPSIKSDDDVHFRFECGEFLRASEIMTVFSDAGQPVESYAKLYRNRHVRLHHGHEEHRQLQSLTAQSEWVQIYNEEELFLEECSAPPRIERHKQGWRYNVIPDEGLPIRKGPSFAAETTGTRLFGGETVLINERVTPTGDKITWLRMKDGEGWLHDVDDTGRQVVIAHSLRHRARTVARSNRGTDPSEEVAYNTIIARLFHNEGGGTSRRAASVASASSSQPIPLRRSNQL